MIGTNGIWVCVSVGVEKGFCGFLIRLGDGHDEGLQFSKRHLLHDGRNVWVFVKFGFCVGGGAGWGEAAIPGGFTLGVRVSECGRMRLLRVMEGVMCAVLWLLLWWSSSEWQWMGWIELPSALEYVEFVEKGRWFLYLFATGGCGFMDPMGCCVGCWGWRRDASKQGHHFVYRYWAAGIAHQNSEHHLKLVSPMCAVSYCKTILSSSFQHSLCHDPPTAVGESWFVSLHWPVA